MLHKLTSMFGLFFNSGRACRHRIFYLQLTRYAEPYKENAPDARYISFKQPSSETNPIAASPNLSFPLLETTTTFTSHCLDFLEGDLVFLFGSRTVALGRRCEQSF